MGRELDVSEDFLQLVDLAADPIDPLPAPLLPVTHAGIGMTHAEAERALNIVIVVISLVNGTARKEHTHKNETYM
jgi:hypothetical protein